MDIWWYLHPGARKSEAEAIPIVVVVVVVFCRCRCRRRSAFNQEAPVTCQHVIGICSNISLPGISGTRKLYIRRRLSCGEQ